MISAVVERLTTKGEYCVIVMESVLCISTIVDNGGDDMVYTDFKNNLYSPVSHITFTHRLRFAVS